MKVSDSQIQQDVIYELTQDPSIDHANVGVAVNGGVVTLSGFVTRFPQKKAAEKAVRRVAGVTALAEEIKVRFASDSKTADHEIAKRIADVFEWDVLIPGERIDVKVEQGWVTLSGTVDWSYQRDEAKRAAGRIGGVVGIGNQIELKQVANLFDIKDRIRAAFTRQANLDAGLVTVQTDGGTVCLGGQVAHWSEREIAERTAWGAPGVNEVRDEIVVAI